ncbi:MAG: excinuclease subunit, partial [Bradyrhizobium sp.]|nr:excinuclease subunit [Bradyrhizobium sp.]
MDHDSTDSPKAPGPRTARRGSEPAPGQPDLPPRDPAQDSARDSTSADIDPATAIAEEEDEARLQEASEAVAEGRLAVGHAAIEHAVRLAPTSPGVYRMLNAA